MSLFLRWLEQGASPCWPHSQVAQAALEKLFKELLLVLEAFYQVVEVFFQVLQLLVGCRVGVAVRASPLQ